MLGFEIRSLLLHQILYSAIWEEIQSRVERQNLVSWRYRIREIESVSKSAVRPRQLLQRLEQVKQKHVSKRFENFSYA